MIVRFKHPWDSYVLNVKKFYDVQIIQCIRLIIWFEVLQIARPKDVAEDPFGTYKFYGMMF